MHLSAFWCICLINDSNNSFWWKNTALSNLLSGTFDITLDSKYFEKSVVEMILVFLCRSVVWHVRLCFVCECEPSLETGILALLDSFKVQSTTDCKFEIMHFPTRCITWTTVCISFHFMVFLCSAFLAVHLYLLVQNSFTRKQFTLCQRVYGNISKLSKGGWHSNLYWVNGIQMPWPRRRQASI